VNKVQYDNGDEDICRDKYLPAQRTIAVTMTSDLALATTAAPLQADSNLAMTAQHWKSGKIILKT